jgi:PAS domain S-box-containing protein
MIDPLDLHAQSPLKTARSEGTAAGLWELDVLTGVTAWSRGLYRLLDYAVGDVVPSWAAFEARVHRDDLARVRLDAAAPSATLEFRLALPGDRVRWVRSSNEVLEDAGGQPVRVCGIVVDIGDEREAVRQRARLAELAERTTNAVVVTDPAGQIEWVNEGFVRLTEYTLDEARGRRPGHLLQGDDTSAETRALMREAIDNLEPFLGVVLNYTRTGRQYWVQLETRPMIDTTGLLTGFISVQTDVTEQRIAAARENLAERVAAMLLTSDSLEEAGMRLVAELVRELDIRTAQLWVVDPRLPTLVHLASASSEPRFDEWVRVSQELSFRKGTDWVVGVGAPGTAWGTGKTYLRTDFWSDDANQRPSRRRAVARSLGIRTVCAVPVFGTDGVLAVLEIGGSESFPGYERLPSLLERAAEQLASFILQSNSRKAFETIFMLSPDCLILVDAGGTMTAANARAEAMFGPCEGRPVNTFIDGASELIAEALVGDVRGGASLIRRDARDKRGATFAAELTLNVTPSSSTQAAILAVRDLTERHRLEAALKQSLREKETLVQEVHHRVKNNLQIISSMVAMQADEIEAPDVRAGLVDTGNRVRTMALVHEQLYAHDDLARIAFGDYANSLCAMLRSSFNLDVAFDVQAEPVEVTIDRAVPCGLILNELVTNALKHGRSADGRCRVHVRIEVLPSGFAFVVADEGQSAIRATERSSSMGGKLIGALVRQLRAKLTTTFSGGTHVRVEVPAE